MSRVKEFVRDFCLVILSMIVLLSVLVWRLKIDMYTVPTIKAQTDKILQEVLGRLSEVSTEHVKSQSSRTVNASLLSDVPASYNDSKNQIKDIYYIKVHKTGSTTMQNILHRFAWKHTLKVALYNREHCRPFPDTAKIGFLLENITEGDNFTRYNIMCDHAVFDEAAFRPYMRSNLRFIATLREPFSQLESSFEYFSIATKFGIANSKDPIKVFLERDPASFTHDFDFTRIQNIQAFDLGYKISHDNNITAINEHLAYLDKKIDVAVISQHFVEGLVYLKELFNWELQDIIYLTHLQGTRKTVPRNETTTKYLKDLHRRLSTADYVFYEHFEKKISSILQNQPASFWQQVSYLKALLKRIHEFCSNVCNLLPSDFFKSPQIERYRLMKDLLKKYMIVEPSQWSKAFNVTYRDCALMSFSTNQYTNALQVHQFKTSACGEGSAHNVPGLRTPVWSKLIVKGTSWCKEQEHVIFTFPLNSLNKHFFENCH